MGTGLVAIPIHRRESRYGALLPLLEGKPVAFVINDPRMRVKTRAAKPVLTITPVSVFGMEGDDLLLAMPGYGSEVVSPLTVKATEVYRVGLTMRTSKILSEAIKQLFLERHQSKGEDYARNNP